MENLLEENNRLDKYISEKLNISRSKVQKLVDDGNILVNGKNTKSSYLLKYGDVIDTNLELDREIDIVGEDIKLDILYEDEYLLVVNKESGMVVHPAPGHYTKTLVNALIYHCNNKLSSVNGNIRPGIVHRIDADTSGVLVVAKNDMVHDNLAKQIKDKTVKREYIALVNGIINEESATIDAPIGRSDTDRKKMCVTAFNSKEAITNIYVLERLNNATLIKCVLNTGRTHQIRVHLDYINHSVVNDPLYGNKKLIDEDFGQMLHAKTLGFIHPVTKEYMEFTSEVPKRFNEIVDMFR